MIIENFLLAFMIPKFYIFFPVSFNLLLWGGLAKPKFTVFATFVFSRQFRAIFILAVFQVNKKAFIPPKNVDLGGL